VPDAFPCLWPLPLCSPKWSLHPRPRHLLQFAHLGWDGAVASLSRGLFLHLGKPLATSINPAKVSISALSLGCSWCWSENGSGIARGGCGCTPGCVTRLSPPRASVPHSALWFFTLGFRVLRCRTLHRHGCRWRLGVFGLLLCRMRALGGLWDTLAGKSLRLGLV